MRRFFAMAFVLLLAAAPAGAALAAEPAYIENQDFSSPGAGNIPSGWYAEAWHDGAGDYLIETAEKDGRNCLHIVNYRENDARLCLDMAVEPHCCYRISCDILAEGIAGGAGANVSVKDTFAFSRPVLDGGGWVRAELTGNTGEGESMSVCLRVGGYGALSKGEAWFRDFSVEKLDHAPENAQDFFMSPSGGSENVHNVNELHGGAMLLAVLFTAALGVFFCRRHVWTLRPESEAGNGGIAAVLAAAFIARCALSLIFYGHATDINCFMAWSCCLAENGPAGFYTTSGIFADYPPGYMLVLYLTGSLARALGLEYGGGGYVLLTKLPAILCDLAAACAVYRLSGKECSRKAALTLAGLVAFNPAMAFISGGWGQVDQVLALLLIWSVWLFGKDRLELAGLIYGLAIITKPQALMAGPLLAAAYFARIKDGGWRYVRRTVLAVLLALIGIVAVSLPFWDGQRPLWLLDKFIGTATSYPYASVEAFNMQSLLGGNWKPADAPLLGMTYGKWGSVMIVLSCGAAIWLYLCSRREKGSLELSMAFMLASIFTFGQYMHERYVFPVLGFIMMGFLACRDRRLTSSFLWYTCALLLNSLAAFEVVRDTALRGAEFHAIAAIGGLMTLGAFVHLSAAVHGILIRRRVLPAFTDRPPEAPDIFDKTAAPEGFTARDRLLCLGLTAACAATALVNLGSLRAPETPWKAVAGDSAVITFPGRAEISEIRVFGGLYEGTLAMRSDSGDSVTYRQENGDMFRWKTVNDAPLTAASLELRVESGSIWLNEIAFFDGENNRIPAGAGGGAAALTDEPDMVPDTPSYLNGMYFDELYHGRTAYEHLHGIAPYENSHPPLGKVFIMLGIALFGMNAFGWRIMGALFGIGMVPIMYLFGKKLFGESGYALLGAGLFALDFMHFTQTRIATIDVYGVFFIILMYYFMYEYYCMNFYTDGLKRTLKPLGLAGLCFGLGAACKWICVYAGGGLAVILFASLVRRFGEYRRYRHSEDEKKRAAVSRFPRSALVTLLWCCLFYIAVPAAIYIASYIPYMLSEARYGLSGIWDVQKFMFSYHSGLTAVHPYESAWWQWPLDLRPVWYYIGGGLPAGYVSTISAFGNPAVWWTCSAGAGVLIGRLMGGGARPRKGVFVLIAGLCANYLPWLLVTRCTFAYHFFASVPFIILLTVYLVQDIDRAHPERAWVKWAWLGTAAALFVLFYPVISGLPAKEWYVRGLEWLPRWTFLGY